MLEEMIHGREQAPLPQEFLAGAYMDSQKEPSLTPEICSHWTRQVFMLDVRQLLAMVRLTHDIHPWKPLLIILDKLCQAGLEAEKARLHLLSIAQQLLDVQGLELLRPRDVMGTPPPMQVVIYAIRR